MKELTLRRALSLAPPTNLHVVHLAGKAILGYVFVAGAPPMRLARVAGKLQRALKLQRECGRPSARIRPRPSSVSRGD